MTEVGSRQRERTPVPLNERIAYGVTDAAAVSGLSRSTLFECMASGTLRSAKVAGRRLILKSDLEAFLRGEAA